MAKANDKKTPAAPKAPTAAKKPGAAPTNAKAAAAQLGERPAFDAKANHDLKVQERAAAAAGEKVKLIAHTVAPGRSVRKGGVRYTEGEAIQLTQSDSDRLLSKGDVMLGNDGAKATQAAADAAEREAEEAAEAAEAQRVADEAAAAAAAGNGQ